MKSALLFVLCLGVAQPAASHIDMKAYLALHRGGAAHKKFDILSLLHGGHKKKPQQNDPTGVLSSIMAATGQGLALAEKHHEKAVQAARSQIQVLLTKQGGALSQAIEQYNKTMAGSLTSLSQTKDTSKKVLSKAEKEESDDSWNSKSGHAQAALTAQVSFVEGEIRQAARKQQAGIRQAVANADLLLEDGVQKLSRKVGDVSDMVKKAQDGIAGATPSVAPITYSFLQLRNEESMDLDKSVAALRSATQQVDASFHEGQKTLKAMFTKVEQALTSGAKAISDQLEASQDEELRGVRLASASGGALVAPTKPSLRSHKKHA